MKISEYYVGAMPATPLAITVLDSRGRSLDLSFYENIQVKMVGSDNEIKDLGNAVLEKGGARQGRFVFVWPTNKSLFNKPGEYLLQLELSGVGKRDFTTTHAIKVRELGGK